MYQSWRDLLFLHWTIDPDEIQRTLPRGLTVDTFNGNAYLGLVPFFMCDIRPRCCPALPGISNFLEMNVRTYVYDEHGTPGVWFYSLDANQKMAVRVARRFFHLPYFDATMQAERRDGGSVAYTCTRKGAANASRFVYQPGKAPPQPLPDTLEFFLVERYILFAHDAKCDRLYTGRVHHPPYPLHNATFEIEEESAIEQAGFTRPDRPPDHAMFSHGVNVAVFAIESV